MRQKFSDAFRGIRHGINVDRSVQIQVIIGLIVIGMATIICLSVFAWVVIILAIGLVLCVEMLNSALEHIGDTPYRREHPTIGRAKDIAAGAVLVASIIAFIVGLIVFLPPLLSGEAGMCWISIYGMM